MPSQRSTKDGSFAVAGVCYGSDITDANPYESLRFSSGRSPPTVPERALKKRGRHDLFKILEERYGRRSTIVTPTERASPGYVDPYHGQQP
jgi:hypothetical protein